MKHSNYRIEIDSLRGISILLVVLYHLGLETFNSGFIGVDIFFVVSGYLITNIILKNRNFHIYNFYEGRVRRLLPALFIMLIITSPIFFYVSNDKIYLKEVSNALLSVILITSNFYFITRTGYFDDLTQFNPFLHTWSLSIEWQFYIIFPFILYFLFYKIREFKLIKSFFILIIFNILLIQIGGNLKTTYPFFENEFNFFSDSVFFSFFSPLSRAWEFIAGSICALFIKKKKNISENNFLLFVGYLLICISIVIINDLNFYPNIFTLLPVFGTVLIIIYENKNSIFYKSICNNFLIFTGKISYSLYLWHFPILVLFKLIFVEISYTKMLIIFFISYLISSISWRYIEKPFRNKNKCSSKKLYFSNGIFLLLTITLISFFQINPSKHNNFEKIVSHHDFGGSLKNIQYPNLKERFLALEYFRNKVFSNNKKKILVVGDSQAEDLTFILNSNNEITKIYDIKLVNIQSYQFYRKNLDDRRKRDKFFNSVAFKKADIIILSDLIYPYKSQSILTWSFKGIEVLNKKSLLNNKIFFVSNLSPVFNTLNDPVSNLLLRSNFQDYKISDNEIKKKM